MWQAARLAGRVHHSRAHSFFAYRSWDPDQLGLLLVGFLVAVLIKPGERLRLAVDDTLFGRTGKRVWGAHYLHDGAQPEGSGKRTRWGNCWVVVVVVINLPCCGDRPVGLPVLFRLFRPKTTECPGRFSQPELARQLIDMIADALPGREIEVVMDGAYASRAWQKLPARVTVTTRMRANAALFEFPPARRPGQRGRPALKGQRLGSLAEIAQAAVFTAVKITSPDGRRRTVHVHRLDCLWYKPFHTQPVTVILIRNRASSTGFDIALASTDTSAATGQLISRYDSRWVIETCHQEAKANGVGDARNRVKNAVCRTVPFGFLCQSITIIWYQLHGNPEADIATRRKTAPWYRQKTTVSYHDMSTALRRALLHAQLTTQAPHTTTNPKIRQPLPPQELIAA
jgi:hypothetical protein